MTLLDVSPPANILSLGAVLGRSCRSWAVLGESCGGIEAVLERSWAVLGGHGVSCGDLKQSRGHVEAVLKRSWGGLRVVLERLGLQDSAKTPKATPRTPPRHATSPLEAPKTPPDATKTPASQAEKLKSIKKNHF